MDIPAVVSSDAQDSSAMDVAVLVGAEQSDSLFVEPEVETKTTQAQHDTLTTAATNTSASSSSSGRASGRVRKSVTPFSPCDYDEIPLTDEQLNGSTSAAAVKTPVALTAQQQEEAYLTELITRRRLEGYYRECPGSVALASSGIVAGGQFDSFGCLKVVICFVSCILYSNHTQR
jgi:hypothetical protein